eukprot:1161295-Pelagomonas_calceolata.AAC.19
MHNSQQDIKKEPRREGESKQSTALSGHERAKKGKWGLWLQFAFCVGQIKGSDRGISRVPYNKAKLSPRIQLILTHNPTVIMLPSVLAMSKVGRFSESGLQRRQARSTYSVVRRFGGTGSETESVSERSKQTETHSRNTHTVETHSRNTQARVRR